MYVANGALRWNLVMRTPVPQPFPGALSTRESGGVTSVMVTPGLPSGAEGSMTQTVYWQSSLLNYYAEIVMVTPDADSTDSSDDDVEAWSGYDIAAQIADEHPAVTITRIAKRESHRRLTGGWAFLIALFFGSILLR